MTESLTDPIEHVLVGAKTLLAGIPHATAICDSARTVRWVNQTWCELFELDQARAVGLHHVGGPEFDSPLDRLFETGDAVRFELRREHEIVLDVSASPVRDADGAVVLAVLVHVDVSQRRRLEAELLRIRDRWDSAERIAQFGAWEWDVRTGEVEWTDGVFRIFGLDAENFTPQIDSILLLSPPEERDRDRELIERAIATHSRGSFEQRFRRPDGSMGTYQSTFEGHYDEDGELVRMVGVAHDVTERKRAEAELLEVERQVQKAQKLESLEVLAGSIGHDFNNILVAILGNADLIAAVLEDGHPAFKHIEQIETATKRAAALARQMLDFSGKGRFISSRVNVSKLMEETVELFRVTIPKPITLELELAEDVSPILADGSQMQQIAMNLITNASESIGDAEGRIRVSTGERYCDRAYLAQTIDELRVGNTNGLREGRYVYLEVADTGCGMDAETRRRIFEPFFTTKFTGRGLGMAALVGIVRSHHGTILLHTAPGEGTCFRVLFPVARREELGEWVASDSTEVVVRSPSETTILVVDDEASVRRVAEAILTRHGYHVLLAKDGLEALERFREHDDDIDCVLLDVMMPVMDGGECLSALRAEDPDVRVVLTSGFDQGAVAARFLDSDRSTAGFLKKPYDQAMLLGQVERALRSHRAAKRTHAAG